MTTWRLLDARSSATLDIWRLSTWLIRLVIDVWQRFVIHWSVQCCTHASFSATFQPKPAATIPATISSAEVPHDRSGLDFSSLLPNTSGCRDGSDGLPHMQQHECVTVLFADIVGFTPLSEKLCPGAVMAMLHRLFCVFDGLAAAYGVYKVETIGDCYMAASGLNGPHNADAMLEFASKMIEAAEQVRPLGQPVALRVGLHSGPLASGCVGHTRPRLCLFGDTVNTASRMESNGVAGCVQVSTATFSLLSSRAQECPWRSRHVEVKGKGLMATHLLQVSRSALVDLAAPLEDSRRHAKAPVYDTSVLMLCGGTYAPWTPQQGSRTASAVAANQKLIL